ncbi:MAG: hypothetical protein Hyperionvirus11_53 [Hyperionvirus sp.]|uniref:Uncharacterized protein n=1 Tax=Hyperionvirus sp. TaxID=2487770 RepID=A0A3G5A927_9VIRU|nr:MAG: hypothetical protein Hyperionvirus11_53 [Hyperionvirus sp.]
MRSGHEQKDILKNTFTKIKEIDGFVTEIV